MVVVVVVVVIVVIVVDTLWNSHANGQSFEKRCASSAGERGTAAWSRRRSLTSSSCTCTRGGGSRDGARRGGRPAVGGRAPWAAATGWATVGGSAADPPAERDPNARLELVLTLLTEVEAGERLSARSSCPRAARSRRSRYYSQVGSARREYAARRRRCTHMQFRSDVVLRRRRVVAGPKRPCAVASGVGTRFTLRPNNSAENT